MISVVFRNTRDVHCCNFIEQFRKTYPGGCEKSRMQNSTILKGLLSVVLLFMIYKVIATSLESNLFEEWNNLGQIPWMEATLYDFYANVLCIFLWIAYKEKSLVKKSVWLVLLVTLGSIGTCLYVLKELFGLKAGEGFSELLTKRNS